jgi:hypothetical protein
MIAARAMTTHLDNMAFLQTASKTISDNAASAALERYFSRIDDVPLDVEKREAGVAG